MSSNLSIKANKGLVGYFGLIDQVYPQRIDQYKKTQTQLYDINYQFVELVSLDRNRLTLNSEMS